jgi:hypothetical protein
MSKDSSHIRVNGNSLRVRVSMGRLIGSVYQQTRDSRHRLAQQ